MKDDLEIKKALLQSLIGQLKDGEGETIKKRPSLTVVDIKKMPMEEGEECDEMPEGEEPEEVDLEDEDTLAKLKKMFGV